MNIRRFILAAFALFLIVPCAAWAEPGDAPESPIRGTIDFKFGSYRPEIGSEFDGSDPWDDVFGGGGLLFETDFSYHLWQGVGSVSIGGSIGYFNKKADSINNDGSSSADVTRMLVLPTRLSAIYRFDYLQDEFNIPIVLSVNAGLDYYFWWVLASNKIADDATTEGAGGTFGWHVGATLYLQLDALSPNMARSLDRSTGINNSYLFAQYLRANVNDFGSDSSWNLSDHHFFFGLGFEF